jgi:hypothetical protein
MLSTLRCLALQSAEARHCRHGREEPVGIARGTLAIVPPEPKGMSTTDWCRVRSATGPTVDCALSPRLASRCQKHLYWRCATSGDATMLQGAPHFKRPWTCTSTTSIEKIKLHYLGFSRHDQYPLKLGQLLITSSLLCQQYCQSFKTLTKFSSAARCQHCTCQSTCAADVAARLCKC